MRQTTNSILMIRPVAFRMNEQTAVNNYYQKVLDGLLPATVNAKAQEEFNYCSRMTFFMLIYLMFEWLEMSSQYAH